ncbi:MAG: hypothetical protein HFE47_06115 [Clostridia bacterium]|nr:hypothetical protein [Clostridia bacterium]
MKITFIGHRDTNLTNSLQETVTEFIKNLVSHYRADEFLFGSRSNFNTLCYNSVSALQQQYTYFRRIYVRAEYEYIDETYRDYLLSMYEDTFFANKAHNAAAKTYIKRNETLIDTCDMALIYCNEQIQLSHSGTEIALRYIRRKKKPVFNFWKWEHKKMNYIDLNKMSALLQKAELDTSDLPPSIQQCIINGDQSELTVNDIFTVANLCNVTIMELLADENSCTQKRQK